jgi:hypothetical protein
MLSMQALENKVKDYGSRKLPLDAFEQWFRDNSRGMFGESDDVLEACLAIEAAFSLLRFDDVSEDEFRKEVAEAIRPFEPQNMYAWRVVKPPDQMPVAKQAIQRWTIGGLPRRVMAASSVALLGCALYGFNYSERHSANLSPVINQHKEV